MKRWLMASTCLLLGLLIGGLTSHSLLQGQAPPVAALPREMTSYRDVVKKVLPAVVSLESRATAVRPAQPRRRGPQDDQIPDEFRRFFEFGDGADGGPAPRLGFGSGLIVDPKGIILTNNHVVDGADQVQVTMQDGRKFIARDIKTDPKTDLAIVRLDRVDGLPFLEFGDSEKMEIGDRVLAVGAPFGLTGTVTSGIISSKGRSLRMNMYEDFLQTDAAINPGNSGGPLVNLEGKVIGINSAIKSRNGGFQGVGLAIASNLARNVMQMLIRDGEVQRGYLGVSIQDLIDRDVAAELGVEKDGGVLVRQVHAQAPGAKAGLKAGDVITELGGKQIRDGRELQTTVASMPLGKPVELRVVRDGKPKTLEVVIEKQPADFGNEPAPALRVPRRLPESTSIDKIGLDVADLNEDLAERLGFKGSTGALIVRVKPGSIADDAGLGAGMLVTRVQKQPVGSAAALKELIEKGSLEKGVLVQVESAQGGTSFVLLKAAGGGRE